MKLNLLEVATNGETRVDRQNSIIRGVRVLGGESRNNRRYTEACMRAAAPKYEGVGVNVDHIETGMRSYRDRFGCLKNVRFAEGGLVADLHANPKHPLAEQLFWDAENAPGNLGLSHHTNADAEVVEGVLVVSDILEVIGVDIVADPATVKSLFESMSMSTKVKEELGAEAPVTPPMEPVMPSVTAGPTPEESISQGFRNAVVAILDGDLEFKEKLANIQALMKAQMKVADTLNGAKKPSAPTGDSGGSDDEGGSTSESVDRKKVAELMAERDSMFLLIEAGVPLDPVFVKALSSLPEKKDREVLVESWAKSAATLGKRPASRGVKLTEGTEDEGPDPKNAKEFAEAIRG